MSEIYTANGKGRDVVYASARNTHTEVMQRQTRRDTAECQRLLAIARSDVLPDDSEGRRVQMDTQAAENALDAFFMPAYTPAEKSRAEAEAIEKDLNSFFGKCQQ